ncbi:MAG: tetratricopeptide repeat protein [Deltaproteobacteria bacterium]|nr:tetratricopeptide repeat protein [Deltaproteobacteria bacterium]
MARLGASVFLFILLLFSYEISHAFRSVPVGSPLPATTVKDLNGREVNLAFGPRPVVLYFWRPNQEFSLDGLKDLEQIKNDFSKNGVEILAVAEGGTTASDAQASIKKLRLSYPVYLDAERKIEEKIGIIVFPSTGIVRGGQLRFYLPSRNSNYRQIIQARLRVDLDLLSEKDFEQQMKQIGEELGGEQTRAQDHFKTGVRLSRQGKAKDALAELNQALSLDPQLIDAHLTLGYAYLDLEDPHNAQREFELVLKRHTASPGAKLGLGISAARLGDLDKGIEILQAAVQINPDPVQGYYELGKAYEKKGNLKEAMHAYKWAVRKLLQGRR